jgi:PPOX class probable FMN-dependent enzyme
MSAAGELPETTDKLAVNEGTVDLDALYAPPSEMIQKAVLDHLVDFHLEYLKAATFFCLATGSEQGLDASPRGGPAGFVHALDAHTVAFADWPGNNRIESLRNIERDGRLGMLFIFPGLEIFMRINGRGELSTEPALLARLAEGDRLPKTATVVRIDQVLLHCGKAVNRAKLWRAESQLAPAALPSVGKIIAALGKRDHPQAGMDDAQIEQINQHYDHSVRHDLY